MSKLVGTGTQGDFVLKGQTLATNQGFKNVSKLWYDKCKTLDQGMEEIADQRRTREDINCKIKEVDFRVTDGKFVVEFLDGREFIPTEKALFDIARWCDQTSVSFIKRITAPALKQNGSVDYNRDEQDAETLCTVLKNGRRRIDKDKEFLFRTYQDGTLRAMLSDRYAIINNLWYMEVIKEVLPGGMLSHWRGNADSIYGNVLIPDSVIESDDSDYGFMTSLSNCEIGTRRLSQYPSVFRAICMNGNIWSQTKGTKINKVHRGNINLLELKTYIHDNIMDQVPLAASLIQSLLDTRKLQLSSGDSLRNIFTIILGDEKLNKEEAKEVVTQFSQYESSDRNLFGIINSITRAGQKFNNDRWVDFDFIGGKLAAMNASNWDRIKSKAKNVTSDDIELVFGA